MKKILLAVSVLMLTVGLGAQQPQRSQKSIEDFRKAAHEKLQSEHVAYLTMELDLTPEEAQAFWPLYNQAQAEQRESFHDFSAAKKELKAAVKEGKDDKEVKKALDAYVKAKAAQRYVIGEYQSKFEKILGVAKTAKLYLAEESFRTKQINRLGSGGKAPQNGNRPQGGSRYQGGKRPQGNSEQADEI